MADQKNQALTAALGQIEKAFGKGAIMRMGDESNIPVAAISTGSLSLDLALGVGGVPRGRIVEIFGPEASGKTTLCYHILAEAQKAGGTCAFIDAEHSMDPGYAAAIGVDIDELLVSQPDSGEQALEICELLVRSGAIDIVCIDSVAALVPKAELEGEIGDSFVGIQARLMSQALRKLAGSLNRSGTVCVFTNQLREKIGVMFGSPETTPGGRALKFYASVRLDIRRIETLKDGAEAYGNRVRVKVVKNKVAPPFRQAEFDVIYGHGISWEGTVLDVGIEKAVVQKSGSFLSFEEERIGQGREKAKAFLREHPDVTQRILNRIQAVTEGSIIPGATVPPPGLALGEVVAERRAAGAGARGAGQRRPGRGRRRRRLSDAARRVGDEDGRHARASARRGRQGAGASGALARGARGAARRRRVARGLRRPCSTTSSGSATSTTRRSRWRSPSSDWHPAGGRGASRPISSGSRSARPRRAPGVRAAEAGEEAAARALLASRAAAGRTPAQRLGLLARRGFSADAAESVLGVLDVTECAVVRSRARGCGEPRAMIASVASSDAQTTATTRRSPCRRGGRRARPTRTSRRRTRSPRSPR